MSINICLHDEIKWGYFIHICTFTSNFLSTSNDVYFDLLKYGIWSSPVFCVRHLNIICSRQMFDSIHVNGVKVTFIHITICHRVWLYFCGSFLFAFTKASINKRNLWSLCVNIVVRFKYVACIELVSFRIIFKWYLHLVTWFLCSCITKNKSFYIIIEMNVDGNIELFSIIVFCFSYGKHWT